MKNNDKQCFKKKKTKKKKKGKEKKVDIILETALPCTYLVSISSAICLDKLEIKMLNLDAV